MANLTLFQEYESRRKSREGVKVGTYRKWKDGDLDRSGIIKIEYISSYRVHYVYPFHPFRHMRESSDSMYRSFDEIQKHTELIPNETIEDIFCEGFNNHYE